MLGGRSTLFCIRRKIPAVDSRDDDNAIYYCSHAT